MTYQEEEQSRLRRQNTREAINLALQGQWREAIDVNKSIIEMFPNDIEALNRLGRAYMELAQYADAEAAYRRTLEIDSYNAIAKKNIQRLALLKKTRATKQQTAAPRLEPQVFIEEIGKAGVVRLHDLARADVLARVVAGDAVNLRVNGSNLIVETQRRGYSGPCRAEARSATNPPDEWRQQILGGDCQLQPKFGVCDYPGDLPGPEPGGPAFLPNAWG